MWNPFKRKIESPPSVGELGGTLPFQSLLTTRHLVPDPKGHIISLSGVRCREIKEDRRVATKMVTTVFVNLLTDALQGEQAAFHTLRFHDSGTGTVAEAIGDTTLGTPCGEARNEGTYTEGASANIYKTVATHTYSGSFAITEHGVFSAASAGTLLDRSVFSAVNVVSGEMIEFTYQLTTNASG